MNVINRRQYVEKINEKMKTKQMLDRIPGYINGMEVFLTPDDQHPTGYTWDKKWNGSGIESVVSAASYEVLKEYRVDVTLPLVPPS